MKRLRNIIERQKDFERFVGFPIDSNLEKDRNELSEKFIFKLIEEAIELRKESPSVMNPWSKKQKEADLARVKEEMSDIFLFFINIMITWRVPIEEMLDVVKKIQDNNFNKVKEKKLKMLNEEILAIPGYTSGIGSGSINPKYMIIGQNPAEGIDHGYKFWSNEEDGSSKVLLPILDALKIRQDCYFTNLVKCTTPNNREPTGDEVQFWSETLYEEYKILKAGNEEMKTITMGTFAKNNFTADFHINHPAYVLRGGLTRQDYEKHIYNTLTSSN